MAQTIREFRMHNPNQEKHDEPDFLVKESDGDYKFWYRRAKYGAKYGCVVYYYVFLLSLIVFISLIWMAQNTLTPWIITWIVSTLLITLYYVGRKNRSRKDGEFVINKNEIRVNEISYPLKDIQSVFLRDHLGNTGDTHTSFMVFGGSGIAGSAAMASAGMAQIGSDVRNLRKRELQKVNYEIRIKFKRKKVKIAEKMDITTAQGLYDAVIEKLQKINNTQP